jgi:hypothetical protein
MTSRAHRWLGSLGLAFTLAAGPLATPALAAPQGQFTWVVHISPAPSTFTCASCVCQTGSAG